MKTLLTLLALGGILAAGAVGFFVTARVRPASASGNPSEVRPAAPAAESAEVAALTGRVGELERLIVGLRADLARLSEDRQRTAVASPASTESALSSIEASNFSAAQRQAIVAVIEADRLRREEERVAEEKQRAEQRILDRAAAVARELGLGVVDEKRLGDLMIAGAAKRDELFQQMREGDFGDDARTRVRESFTALRDAYQADLNGAFGADLAKQIMERTDLGGGRRGGEFMGAGGGPGFGQMGGGQGDGGQGRRRGNGGAAPGENGGNGGNGGGQ